MSNIGYRYPLTLKMFLDYGMIYALIKLSNIEISFSIPTSSITIE